MRRLACAFLVSWLVASQVATAQPVDDRKEVKGLMQTGVKLLEAHDYAGALTIFVGAYKKYPSAKILLNIGTTLKLLDRKADAANAYQRFLDSPDIDPARRSEVIDVLADLDKSVGKVTVTITPADAEVMVNNDWWPAANAKLVRVNPGLATLKARRDGFQPGEKNVEVAAGGQAAVSFELAAIPKPVAKPVIITVHDEVPATVLEGPRSRIGAFAMAHVSVVPKLGSAWLVGPTADVTDELAVDAAAILGPGLVSSGMTTYPAEPPKFGLYAGARFALMMGQLRPLVSAGMPVFFSNGARFTARAAGGVEYEASRHVAITFELGFEENINPENDIHKLAVVPAVAATGRL
jgi:hypothetical protein